jgi:hypothetical protein
MIATKDTFSYSSNNNVRIKMKAKNERLDLQSKSLDKWSSHVLSHEKFFLVGFTDDLLRTCGKLTFGQLPK